MKKSHMILRAPNGRLLALALQGLFSKGGKKLWEIVPAFKIELFSP